MATPLDQALTGEWQFVAELSLRNRPIPGNWDAIDGGDTTSDTRSYRPGGRVDPQAMPGGKTTTDITLERAYRGSVDGPIRRDLAANVGQFATVKVFAMDENRAEVPGTLETITGIIKEVTRPMFRSEADGVAL